MGRELLLYLFSNPLDGTPVELTLSRDGVERQITLDPKVRGFRIGISYQNTEEKARLSQISPDSPAEKAGLKQGDIVLSINNTVLESGHDMQAFLEKNPPDGSPMLFELLRGEEKLSLRVTPEAYETNELGFDATYVYQEWDGNLFHLLGAGVKEIRF